MIVSHCATGRGRAVRLWGVALCDGWGSRCATLASEFPNRVRDVPSRGRRCPHTRGLGSPHGDFVFPHRDLGFPCTRRRFPLRRWVLSPVPGFGFPCTGQRDGWKEPDGAGTTKPAGTTKRAGTAKRARTTKRPPQNRPVPQNAPPQTGEMCYNMARRTQMAVKETCLGRKR